MKIKPDAPGGVRDYSPSEMIFRLKVLDTIQQVFSRFGFDPLETPVLERTLVLTGGKPEDVGSAIYRAEIYEKGKSQEIGLDPDRQTSLRFDLTVPLARYVAANMTKLQFPFKRQQRGLVFRGEKPQAGRYREFIQFDADTVGTSSMMADAEIIELMASTLEALRISRFVVKFNNRKILNGLSQVAGFEPAKVNGVLRALDKLDKIGLESVVAELRREPDNEFDGSALNLPEAVVDQILAFLNLTGETDELIGQLKVFFANSPLGLEGIGEIEEIVSYLRASGLPETQWKLDTSIARGLGYYTGPVFETQLLDLPEIGSVFSGGRYDGLIGRFADYSPPATGASVGVDRLFKALETLELIPRQPTVTQVLVAVLDKSLGQEYTTITQELRRAGINATVYLGDKGLKEQIGYAAKMEIPVMVVIGSEEVEGKIVKIKDMRAHSQESVPRAEIVQYIQQVLGRV